MFNPAMIYDAKYKVEMAEDFKKNFPGVFDNIEISFTNDPQGGDTWADVVCVRGIGLYNCTMFCVYLGKFWGNCGVSTVSKLSVGNIYCNKGIGKWLLNYCVKIMTEMGNTIAIGTTNDEQIRMANILEKSGWKLVKDCCFNNRRTKKEISFWMLGLPENEKIVPSFGIHTNVI